MKRTEPVVPLTVLVEEGFGASPGELVDQFDQAGVAITTDHAGRLAVSSTVAETMRAERAERERREAEQRAERARAAAEVAAVEAAQAQQQQEATARRHARIRRLEQATGLNVVQLEIGLRRSLINAPDTGMSYDDRQRLEDRGFTLDEIEAFVLREYGVDTLEEVTR